MALAVEFKALAIWLTILVLAIANGGFREAVLIPALGKPAGLILSGLFLSGLILAVAYFALPRFGRLPARNYLAIGIAWLCLTLLFEFTFGRLVQAKPWPQILEAYQFKDGNIWPIVLLVVTIAPYVSAKIRAWV